MGASGALPRATDLSLVVKAPGDPALDGQKTQLRTVAEARAGRSCSTLGTSLKTASGAAIGAARGTAILWRSPSFELQARYSDNAGLRPVAVAIRSGTSVVLLDPAHWVPPHLPLAGWHEVSGPDGKPLAASGPFPESVGLKTDHGEALQIEKRALRGATYLDLRATLPDTDPVEGLCGRLQGPPGPPVDRKGAVGKPDDVARSWLAAPDEDLFVCGKHCTQQQQRPVTASLCTLPASR